MVIMPLIDHEILFECELAASSEVRAKIIQIVQTARTQDGKSSK